MRMKRTTLVALAVLMVISRGAMADGVDFQRDIQPLFVKHCYSCHGADKQRGGLRLDIRKAALEGGDIGPSWIAGKANESEIIKRVRGDDPDEIMPPKGDPLTKAEVALLAKWIDGGAVWPEGEPAEVGRRKSDHWSFQPVVRPALPKVKDESWPRNGIDHFILAKLESQGLKPSPEADRYTLIRRLYLDLLGLLPTPEEADAFAKDTSKDAYEKLVDRLLASPHHGERWGRHWLDQARYADSNGYSVDSPRTMWPYRDWVIRAINDDMPFDEFTIAQLAGDLLIKERQAKGKSETPDRQSEMDLLIATAFHRNTMINQEGGVKADQFRIEASYDRVATTSQVWLALTMACAQCHTHKFDPITQKEYYQFFAFFNSTEDDNNIGPTVQVVTPEIEQRLASMERSLAAAEQKLRDLDQAQKTAAGKTPASRQAAKPGETRWITLEPVKLESKGGATLKPLDDGSILVTGKLPANDTYEITAKTKLPRLAGLRLEALTHDSLPSKGPGLISTGNFVLTKLMLEKDGKEIPWSDAQASHSQPGYPIEHAIDDERDTGWAINVGKGTPAGVRMNDNHTAYFLLAEPILTGNATFRVSLRFERNPNYLLGRFRLSFTDDVSLLRPETLPAGNERETLVKEIASLKKQITDGRKNVPSLMVMRELPKPRPSHIFIRGDFLRLGPEVTPDVPEVLPELKRQEIPNLKSPISNPKSDISNPKSEIRNPKSLPTRLDLARWLVSPENPLTPRVTMNRVWMRYFPKGLVETEEDFGTQGSRPTHPELLDWLAGEFVSPQSSTQNLKSQISDLKSQISNSQSPIPNLKSQISNLKSEPASTRHAPLETYTVPLPWSMKHMHKLIVTSATYRQASHHRDDLAEIDPFNKLLARQSRLRVEAEIIRDLSLAAGGLLSSKIGGPSVRPPQPPGVYEFTQNRQGWTVATGEDRYRRGIYTFFFRSAPYPMLSTFDVPSLTQTCTARIRSNTPLQSLTLANDEAMFEMAQGLASRVLATKATDADRMARLFRLCLTRQPDAFEVKRMHTFLIRQRDRFTKDTTAAKQVAPQKRPKEISDTEAAAWTAVARAVMNLDEFITRE